RVGDVTPQIVQPEELRSSHSCYLYNTHVIKLAYRDALTSSSERGLDAHRPLADDDRSPTDLDARDVRARQLDLRKDVAGTLHEHALQHLDRAGALGRHEAVLHHEARRRARCRSGAGVLGTACSEQTRIRGRR